MNNEITPAAVRARIKAEGGWQGKFAKRHKLYPQLVRYWLKIGIVPHWQQKRLRRAFKASE